MPPILPPRAPKRLVLYHQTIHPHRSTNPISLAPLLSPFIGLTHLIIAAFHLHAEDPFRIHLNDDLPSDPKYDGLWRDVKMLQAHGVKVMAMVGGAAAGSFSAETLGAASEERFRVYYEPLRDLLRKYGFDGVDVDVEQEMSLPAMMRLIDALRADFSQPFLITLAPVAAAMLELGNLSGFSYPALERLRGREIAFYNTQFYNNWGDTSLVPSMQMAGWDLGRIVIGQLTCQDNGHGYENLETLKMRMGALAEMGYEVGGVMGWEYFNCTPGGRSRPWIWAEEVSGILGVKGVASGLGYVDYGEEDAKVPKAFEYESDGMNDE